MTMLDIFTTYNVRDRTGARVWWEAIVRWFEIVVSLVVTGPSPGGKILFADVLVVELT